MCRQYSHTVLVTDSTVTHGARHRQDGHTVLDTDSTVTRCSTLLFVIQMITLVCQLVMLDDATTFMLSCIARHVQLH